LYWQSCCLSHRWRQQKKLNGAGATFPYPVYSAWAFDYSKVTGVQLNYQSIGSGGGVRQITDRTVDFGASDDPMKPEQLKKDKLLQFPAVIGGVVPVGNLEGIAPGQLKLDSGTLCRIFLGEIKTWNDDSVKKMNPGLKLPQGRLRLYIALTDQEQQRSLRTIWQRPALHGRIKSGPGKRSSSLPASAARAMRVLPTM